MKKSLAEKMIDACNEEGIELEIYEEYSGRGMYGKTTTGIVIAQNDPMEDVMVACRKHDVNIRSSEFQKDSLGLSKIIY